MRKGSKKETVEIYKGPDYKTGENGIEYVIPGSPEYYSVRDITAEARKILVEHKFTLSKLFNLPLDTGIDGEQCTLLHFCDKSTLHRYFSSGKDSLPMPYDMLQKLPSYMEGLEDSKDYLAEVDKLREKIERYCIETKQFAEEMRDYLKRQNTGILLQFLKSIYVLQLSEETWCYWLCYEALNSEKQREAKSILSGCTGLLPNYEKLFSLYFFNRKDDIAFQHLILTAEEKHSNNETKLKEALIEIALSHFGKFPDKVAVASRVWDIMNFGISLSPADWSILLTYEHLCGKREISKAGEYVLSVMDSGKHLQKGCSLELASYFTQRFREQVEEREENELEQYLSSDGETEN